MRGAEVGEGYGASGELHIISLTAAGCPMEALSKLMLAAVASFDRRVGIARR